jgi:integrase
MRDATTPRDCLVGWIETMWRHAGGRAPLGTVQALLGHSTAEITRDVYLHAIPEDQRRAVESVERLVFGPKWTQVQALPKVVRR